MRELRKWAWAAVVSVVAAAPATAQQGSVISGGGISPTGTLSGTGGLAGGGAGQLGSSGLGGSSSLSGGSNTGSSLQGTALQSMQAPPKLTPPTGQSNNTLASSNFLAGYYANPYYQGIITAQTNATPGGFGSPLYGNSGGVGPSNSRGGAGALGGAALGGRGLNSATNNSNISGIVVPIPVQISYAAQMYFPTPPVAATRMQTELRSVIDATPQIANAKGVEVLLDANNNVTLRGSVKDDEEARLIEGMVRLTPGVGYIRNELTATSSAGPRR
jgi:hypothetical protein